MHTSGYEGSQLFSFVLVISEKRIKISTLIEHGKKKIPELGKLYGYFSNKFTHANLLSISSIISKSEKKSTEFHIIPYYDKSQAEYCLTLALILSTFTLSNIMVILKKQVKKMKTFEGDFAIWVDVMEKYLKNKKFKVIVNYNKKHD